jgi:hypothetical protein
MDEIKQRDENPLQELLFSPYFNTNIYFKELKSLVWEKIAQAYETESCKDQLYICHSRRSQPTSRNRVPRTLNRTP